MDRYEVVIVRYAAPPRMITWRDVPTQYVEVGEPMRNLALPLASVWVRAFNQAEIRQPYGVWAIVRRQDDGSAGESVETGMPGA
jgi:hypothetical protein